MGRGSKILFLAFILLLVATAVLSYERIVVSHDYDVVESEADALIPTGE